ncbi:FtsP/CotA-like multicopper oxidase with cupredoxin domain [Actinoplanes octamycinicus]|uniref:FtsP/CotA-like multicopper oxidase with cupredoxin domain n=1 Tax=Actinoplanes octamycinicus TaxID=135948 RepID=A0A7W7GZN7_9ACTN|nr:multicopper oxidase domain-containing protein [Actinoplanes octamycinicus]MBB4741223.1 FtsP/CotA-like multicopper oxidase with cupredoxin domain [Actinoplanes octamycinicus]GIE56130.1 multicopper oxidase [Actinoplanes octamycinicus]
MKRRDLLSLAALATLGACSSGTGKPTFSHRLRIPDQAPATTGPDGARQFALTLQTGRSEILPGRSTATWGINGLHLGPVVRVRRGDRVRIAVTNRLPEASTLHWHGLYLPARMDGGPHQMIEPGATWTPEWTVDQPATTSWFHPHPHGRTAMHVYRGVAGLFLVDDPAGPPLPSRYGVDDIPLIVQDKAFDGDGEFTTGGFGGTFGMLGDTVLVNGTAGARFEATTSLVRFRLLNASNARVYRAGFADGRSFRVVATDSGPLARPVTTDRVKISPGERAEIVVAFVPGETVVMDSRGEPARQANDIEEEDFDLLTVVAAGRLAPSPAIPAALGGGPPPVVPPGARVRRFSLSGSEINGRDMDLARIDEVVPAGAHEIWEIDNTTYAHNFHVHDVTFRILDINGAPPPEYQAGPKDTVFIPKKARVRLSISFGKYTDATMPYMYHCHILRHEDRGMMGQFVVVAPGTESQVSRTLATGHHHG